MIAVIDFTPIAKRYACFGTWTVKIFLKDEEGRTVGMMDFNETNLERLRKSGIPIIDKREESMALAYKFPEEIIEFGKVRVGEIFIP